MHQPAPFGFLKILPQEHLADTLHRFVAIPDILIVVRLPEVTHGFHPRMPIRDLTELRLYQPRYVILSAMYHPVVAREQDLPFACRKLVDELSNPLITRIELDVCPTSFPALAAPENNALAVIFADKLVGVILELLET